MSRGTIPETSPRSLKKRAADHGQQRTFIAFRFFGLFLRRTPLYRRTVTGPEFEQAIVKR
jgi:hypothetical protein